MEHFIYYNCYLEIFKTYMTLSKSVDVGPCNGDCLLYFRGFLTLLCPIVNFGIYSLLDSFSCSILAETSWWHGTIAITTSRWLTSCTVQLQQYWLFPQYSPWTSVPHEKRSPSHVPVRPISFHVLSWPSKNSAVSHALETSQCHPCFDWSHVLWLRPTAP